MDIFKDTDKLIELLSNPKTNKLAAARMAEQLDMDQSIIMKVLGQPPKSKEPKDGS